MCTTMVDYVPLLTGSGIVRPYDPSAPCAPPPGPRPVSPTYDPWGAPPPRPQSPTYDPWGNDDAEEAVDLSYNMPGVAAYEPAATNLSVDGLSSAGACEIERLRFLVRSPEEIVKLSAVEVTTANISVDGVPVRGGLRDPRFGPSAGVACATCHATWCRQSPPWRKATLLRCSTKARSLTCACTCSWSPWIP